MVAIKALYAYHESSVDFLRSAAHRTIERRLRSKGVTGDISFDERIGSPFQLGEPGLDPDKKYIVIYGYASPASPQVGAPDGIEEE